MEENSTHLTMLPPTLKPAIPPEVHLSLTCVFITLYSLLFFMVYIQLWLVLRYKHKRFSYQTVFLFLCMLWSGLRTTLFSFYFKNCTLANNLDTFSYWLLYCFPVCLQFITLCLMVLYFAQLIFRAAGRHEHHLKHRIAIRVALSAAVATFLTTNIACAVISKQHDDDPPPPFVVTMLRVVINDTLFIVCGIGLSICIYKMSKISSARLILENRGTSVLQAVTVSTLIILLYTSRAVYNMIAISKPVNNIPNFGLNWINVSDQADNINLNQGLSYVSFGVVLFVWEFLPTCILVLFFRVKRPKQSELAISTTAVNPQNTRAYFFDNPRRYDSDDDLTRSPASRGSNSAFDNPTNYSINSPESTPRPFGSYVYGQGHQNSPPSMNFTPRSITPPNGQPHFYDGT